MSTSNITSLAELHGFPKERPTWHAEIVQDAMNGGKVSESDLATLDEFPEVSALTVSGLEQKSLEYLVHRHGERLTALHLWKSPRIEDFAPLESMPRLTHVAVFWNQRAQRLWNLRKTPALRGLRLNDLTKLRNLDDLSNATSMEELEFGNANWSKMTIETLEPLRLLSSLRKLSFNPKEVVDQRIQPLADLQQIEDLSFSSRLFTSEQIAWLRAKLPISLKSDSLEPYRTMRQPLLLRGKRMDVLVNGKGKLFLSTTADTERIKRFTTDFFQLVEKFERSPALEPRLREPT